jgi:hypothetical protein
LSDLRARISQEIWRDKIWRDKIWRDKIWRDKIWRDKIMSESLNGTFNRAPTTFAIDSGPKGPGYCPVVAAIGLIDFDRM